MGCMENELGKVRVNTRYIYRPVALDIWDPKTDLEPGDEVIVRNLPGLPTANTIGHCHVIRPDGTLAGLVLVNSLAEV